MGKNKRFTRAIAFLIAVVMFVSLSPLDIVAESVSQSGDNAVIVENIGETDGIDASSYDSSEEVEIENDTETDGEQSSDIGVDKTASETEPDASAIEGDGENAEQSDNTEAEVTDSSESETDTPSEDVSSDENGENVSAENGETEPATDDATGDTSANEDVSSDEPAEGAEADTVVTDNITLYSSYSNVTLKGELPVDGSVTAEKHSDAASVEKNFIKGLKNLFGIRSSDPAGADLASYDITIYDGTNTLWQPEDGKTVEVTIYDESFESVPFVNVYH
ncbi:MAG: hypothetical protein IJK34_03875, partial [Clostridia bacterium]|nr:hypothetical protein [Clostridia bacterium]